MECPHCGHWNDDAERRCSRCGRLVQKRRRVSQAHSRLEPDQLLAPAPSSGLEETKLRPSDPVWKQELNRKLDGYRSRQRLPQKATEVQQRTPGTRLSSSAEGKRHALSARSASDQRGDWAGIRTVPPKTERLPDPRWRRVTKAPSSPRLPPLRRASGDAIAAKQSSPARFRDQECRREVACSAPVAPVQIRALAGLLDLALIVVALGVFVAAFYLMGGAMLLDKDGLRSIVFAFLAITSFYWIFYVRFLGETAGMTWLGLRVLNFDGKPPTGGQRWTRALGTILSTGALGLGFAWSLADEEKLTWHDRMSKTFVTRDELSWVPQR